MALGLGIANELLETPVVWSPNDPSLNQYLNFWYAMDEEIAQDIIGRVSAWGDLSSNDNHAVQTNTVYQPSLTISGITGATGTPTFNGTSQYMDLSSQIRTAQGASFAICACFYLGSSSNRVLLSDSAAEFFEILTAKKLRFKANGGGALTTVRAFEESIFEAERTIYLIIQRDADDNIAVYAEGNGEDEVDYSTSGQTNISNDRGFDIVNLGVRNDADRHFDGRINEIFMFNTRLDAQQRVSVMNYFTNKFPE